MTNVLDTSVTERGAAASDPTELPTRPTLVVGHSCDSASQGALWVAAEIAWRMHARLHVVHGIDLNDYPTDPDSSRWDEHAREQLAAQREQVEAVLTGAGVPWTYHAEPGLPVAVLRNVAEEHNALMIVVGASGPGVGPALHRLLGGSVSHGVISHQTRPVLVVPAGLSADPNPV
jgi:nucleotide-binding universal stress UspA family protein